MLGAHAIQVEGKVIERMSNGLLSVELENGHRLRAFASRKAKAWMAGLKAGDRVRVALTPFDFSTGRLCPPDMTS